MHQPRRHRQTALLISTHRPRLRASATLPEVFTPFLPNPLPFPLFSSPVTYFALSSAPKLRFVVFRSPARMPAGLYRRRRCCSSFIFRVLSVDRRESRESREKRYRVGWRILR